MYYSSAASKQWGRRGWEWKTCKLNCPNKEEVCTAGLAAEIEQDESGGWSHLLFIDGLPCTQVWC